MALLGTGVLGDLAVHCTANDFSGRRWRLRVYRADELAGSHTCGYSMPNTNKENIELVDQILAARDDDKMNKLFT